MKVMTVLGTRPEIIRLSRIIEQLDQTCEHTLVHTGQNYDTNLNDIFFQQLGVRAPDHFLGAQGSLGEQVSILLCKIETLLKEVRPDRFLILGDTNSALTAIIAKRMGIPVYHMEAGNRCYDDRVPEEVNRRIIDHSSDILMPYTERSRKNLLREGFAGERVYVTGNPILGVIESYQAPIEASTILEDLHLDSGEYFLVTLHRAENVDLEQRLRNFTLALERLHQKYKKPVIVSTHPHTRDRMRSFGIAIDHPEIRFLEPFGFFQFIKLEKNALCLLSDSGTVQEEACIFRVPNVTLRDVTERPETIECGSNVLTGADPDRIIGCVDYVLSKPADWQPVPEYLVHNVTQTVMNILLGYNRFVG